METNLPYHIIIESVPKDTVSWVTWLSSFLTPLIAILAVYIAYQQYSINRKRFQFEVYERRLAIYQSIQSFFIKVTQEGKTTYQMCFDFAFDTAEVAFIFNKTIQDRINEIYKKSIKLADIHGELYANDGTPKPLNEEETKILAKQITELLKWIREQRNSIKELFQKEMALK